MADAYLSTTERVAPSRTSADGDMGNVLLVNWGLCSMGVMFGHFDCSRTAVYQHNHLFHPSCCTFMGKSSASFLQHKLRHFWIEGGVLGFKWQLASDEGAVVPSGSRAAPLHTSIHLLHKAGTGASRDSRHSLVQPSHFTLVLSIYKRVMTAFPFPSFLLLNKRICSTS